MRMSLFNTPFWDVLTSRLLLRSSDLTLAGGSDCVHGSDWFRRARKGGRDRSGGWDLYPHAEQRVCFCGPQHLHDRPQPGTSHNFMHKKKQLCVYIRQCV